jgi:phosphate transport system substrate-binding protein
MLIDDFCVDFLSIIWRAGLRLFPLVVRRYHAVCYVKDGIIRIIYLTYLEAKMFRFNNWNSIIAGLSLTLLVVTGCSSVAAESAPSQATPPKAQVVLKVSGSGSATAVLSAIQSSFEADTHGYRLEVLPGTGTSGGVEGIVQGVLDVAAMARPPKDEEAAQNVEYVEFGQAGQAVITHPDMGVSDLTAPQVAAIFFGEITNWSEIGGPNRPIILYVRDEGDSSTKALRSVIMKDIPFAESVAQVFTSQGDMLTAVAGTPDSLGIVTWPTALANGADVQAVSIDGVAPGDSSYPMTSPLGIGYRADRQTDMQPLIDWLRSEQGRAALGKYDMITPAQ